MKSVNPIVAHVRTRLSRQISDSLIGPSGYVPVVVLSSEWEDILAGSLVGPPEDRQLALGQDKLREFLDRLRVVVDSAVHNEAMDLLCSQLDKTYSLCDAVSLVLMRQRGMVEALMTDRHFDQAGFKRLLSV